MTRTPLIAGNWKMHKTRAEARAFLEAVRPRDGVDAAVCAPFTALAACLDAAGRVAVFAQNMHEAPNGAFTGEVSAPMLVEIGVHGVVVGHSERRQYFNETDRALQHKVPAALEAGLVPILCVGETEDEREAGDTERKLRHQVQEGLRDVPGERLGDVVIAYEPVWAIGTGKVATVEQATEMHQVVRATLDRVVAPRIGAEVAILYGGSVNAGNAASLFASEDLDGALVGGASLEPAGFWRIVAAAGGTAAR